MTQIEAIRYFALVALLLLATRHDLLSHRIPNVLSIGGAATGLALAALASGVEGLMLSAAGLAIGLLGLLPFHLRKAMGAGDVKLMGAVGSFVGPKAAVLALGFTLVLGALLALGLVLAARLASRDRLASLLSSDATAAATPMPGKSILGDRFPYAAAILFGTLAALAATGVLAPLLATIGLPRPGGG